MTKKRKVSYEQDQALAAGRDTARANQRRRTAANARRADEQRERDDAARKQAARCADGWHEWTNWQYSADYKTETRGCRECDHTETRPVRL